MQCQECLSRLSEYLDQKMDSRIDPGLHEHLEDCSNCQEEFRLLERTVQLIRDLPPLAVPLDLRANIQNKIQKEKNHRWQWYKASTFGLALAAGLLLLLVIWPRFSRLNTSESSVANTESQISLEKKMKSPVVAKAAKAKESQPEKFLSKKMEKRRQSLGALEERKDQLFRDEPTSAPYSFDAGETLAEEDLKLDVAGPEENTMVMQEAIIVEEDLSSDDYADEGVEKEAEKIYEKAEDGAFLARNEKKENLGRRFPGENTRELLESGKTDQDTLSDKKEPTKTLAKNNPVTENKANKSNLTKETASRLKEIMQSVFGNGQAKEKAGKQADYLSSSSAKKELYYTIEYQKEKKSEEEPDLVCTIVASDLAQAKKWITEALPVEKILSKKENEEENEEKKPIHRVTFPENGQELPLDNSDNKVSSVSSLFVWKKHLQEHQWRNFISSMKAKKGTYLTDTSKFSQDNFPEKGLNVKIILIQKNTELLKESNTKKE